MARGRKKTPTKLRELRGNPGKRPINKEEPKVEERLGPPPMHLNQNEKRLWNEYAAVGYWLTAANRGAFEGFVSSLAMMIRVKPEIEKALIFQGPNGGPIHNPYLAIYNKAKEHMLKFASELGFTPTSITRIHAPEKDEPKKNAHLLAFDGGKK